MMHTGRIVVFFFKITLHAFMLGQVTLRFSLDPEDCCEFQTITNCLFLEQMAVITGCYANLTR